MPALYSRAMRIIFMGTPEFALPALHALAKQHDVVAVYSQPPRPAQRGKKLQKTPVHMAAEALGIAVETPRSLKAAEEQARFAAHDADVAVVAAYGLILPQAILDAPTHGCINIHGSILPRWRGAAPVHRAILAGDRQSGVAIMQMDAGLDTGNVRAEKRIDISGMTGAALMAKLADLGADLLIDVLANLPGHPPRPQSSDGITYAAKIDKGETHIDWNLTAVQVERMVRAFAPAPGAWFAYRGERFRILAAEIAKPGDSAHGARPGTLVDDALSIACNPGILRPTIIQRAGRGAMPVADLLRGFAFPAGDRIDG